MKKKDLIGQRFGRLIVIEEATPLYRNGNVKDTRHRVRQWICQCDCGNTIIAQQNSLVHSKLSSCGCLGREKLKNLVGMKFGLLTVISESERVYIGKSKSCKRTFICKCECGALKTVIYDNLMNGDVTTCGNPIHHTVIGDLAHHRLHGIWNNMQNRCNNSKSAFANIYHDRGIRVCEEWSIYKYGYINFYNWAMENGYKDSLTIDRIDNDKGYSPDNCRWISNREQQRNKRNNRLLTLNGVTKCASEWAEELGININTIFKRLGLGWSDQKILTTPVDKKKSHTGRKNK